MTLHAAKGLEFDTVFLPGWEEGVFPHQRALDDQGRAGLEEERRLAHVGITRARKRAKIYFATNRRMHGLWQTNIPSRFLDELPEANVEVTESQGRLRRLWRLRRLALRRHDLVRLELQHARLAARAGEKSRNGGGFSEDGARLRRRRGSVAPVPGGRGDRAKPPAEGAAHGSAQRRRLVALTLARPRRASPRPPPAAHHRRRTGRQIHRHRLGLHAGDRVFHQKFGNGNVTAIDGNKLTIQFDKAGEKRVVDSFVERV